jgi:hypothetical protein
MSHDTAGEDLPLYIPDGPARQVFPNRQQGEYAYFPGPSGRIGWAQGTKAEDDFLAAKLDLVDEAGLPPTHENLVRIHRATLPKGGVWSRLLGDS